MRSMLRRGLVTFGLGGCVALLATSQPLTARSPIDSKGQTAIHRVGGFEKAQKVYPAPNEVPTAHQLPPVTAKAAQTWKKLGKLVPVHFPQETELDDFLKYVRKETTEPGDKGIVIYIDPLGLQEAEKTMTSPTTIDLEGIPLATTLDLVLKQLGLFYAVQEDGILVITSGSSTENQGRIAKNMREDLDQLRLEVDGLMDDLGGKPQAPAWRPTPEQNSAPSVKKTATVRRVQFGHGGPCGLPEPVNVTRLFKPLSAKEADAWLNLRKPINMAFPNETKFEDMLKYIKKATRDPKDKNDPGLQIYVDPIALQQAEKTMTSPVQLDLEGVPLATSLNLMLKQLGLKYVVQEDGLVIVTDEIDAPDFEDHSAHILDTINAVRLDIWRLRRLAKQANRAK